MVNHDRGEKNSVSADFLNRKCLLMTDSFTSLFSPLNSLSLSFSDSDCTFEI
jgi:hypothetical protein